MQNQDPLPREKQNRIFLTYARSDREIASRIARKIPIDSCEIKAGDSVAQLLTRALSVGDYAIVLLSPNSASEWAPLADGLANSLATRDITMLPVVIGDGEIPRPFPFSQFWDWRTNWENNLSQLSDWSDLIPKIDFHKLDLPSFEELSIDLLAKMGFNGIERNPKGKGFKFKANYWHQDPFGAIATETWLVNISLYREARASLRLMRQLAEELSTLPAQSKGLLIADSDITSAARDGLEFLETKQRIELRVVSGTELKRLLLQYPELVERHFGKTYAAVT